jgi:XRE family transcriptional regulator, regulator of sulfur utilization
MANPSHHLASTLKAIRSNRRLSLDKVAALTGVSKAMLGQIERAESSPTVAVLWKIATGLGIPMSVFVEPALEPTLNTVIRDADELRRQHAQGDLQIAPLFPFDARFGFEYSELTFSPGYSRISEPHEAGVVEHISVMQGELEILSEGNWQLLRKGQSIRFRGDREHGYRNITDADAVVIIVIHYAHGRS